VVAAVLETCPPQQPPLWRFDGIFERSFLVLISVSVARRAHLQTHGHNHPESLARPFSWSFFLCRRWSRFFVDLLCRILLDPGFDGHFVASATMVVVSLLMVMPAAVAKHLQLGVLQLEDAASSVNQLHW